MRLTHTSSAAVAGAVLLVGLAIPPSADAAGSSGRSADRLEQRLGGERVRVEAESLPVFRRPAKIFIGTLMEGESFRVDKLSASGKYAYGFAYGDADKRGWVSTSGLDVERDGDGDDDGPLRLVGTPSVRYTIDDKEGVGRYVSLGVVLRANRALTRADQHAVAAPQLRRGQRLPDALFGGLTLRTIGDRSHCYVGEVAQLSQRRRVEDRTWRLGLFADQAVVTPVKRVTLKRVDDDSWEHAAARRLGC